MFDLFFLLLLFVKINASLLVLNDMFVTEKNLVQLAAHRFSMISEVISYQLLSVQVDMPFHHCN